MVWRSLHAAHPWPGTRLLKAALQQPASLDDGCVILQLQELLVGLRGLAALSAEVDDSRRGQWEGAD